MKNVFKLFGIIALAAIIGFSFTACKDEPDNNTPPPKPIEVTFNVPAECANLNKTKPITIIFPGTFTDTARQNTIKGKFVDSMAGLEERAGKSADFKTKINAILDRGLTITIEETNSISYYMKVVNNQLVIETAYIEYVDVNGGVIAGTLIGIINRGELV